MKIIYISKLLRKYNEYEYTICMSTTPLTQRTSTSPLRSVCPIIARYRKTLRMNLFRTRKLFRMDQLTRIHLSPVCRMSTTPPAWYLPPPNTLSDNHPELAVHPRMNSRSE